MSGVPDRGRMPPAALTPISIPFKHVIMLSEIKLIYHYVDGDCWFDVLCKLFDIDKYSSPIFRTNELSVRLLCAIYYSISSLRRDLWRHNGGK